MQGKYPNQSSRINRVILTKKKDDAITIAANKYFFGSAIVTNTPAPIFAVFGR